MELRRLLRLRPDYRDEKCWRPESREEFMTIAAREALRDGNCKVVGGFIRDWIIRGEVDVIHGTPKDVDLYLWKAFDIPQYIARCRFWGLSEQRDSRRRIIRFATPFGDEFNIDYVVADDQFADPPRPIDLDVNSLAVSVDRGLHKHEYHNRPLCKTYGNIKRKYAYLIQNNPSGCDCSYMTDRVNKMKSRGWTVIHDRTLAQNCAGNTCDRNKK